MITLLESGSYSDPWQREPGETFGVVDRPKLIDLPGLPLSLMSPYVLPR